jgi:S-adenosylmethionine:diacylglycerol 3-amino-3-carboxypropyl transferase
MTGWLRGRFSGSGPPQLLFGQMWEDPAIELAIFPPGARIFAIASAGCTARALSAHGCRVTAVDINPAQLAYARSRGPVQDGVADRGLAHLRRLAPLAGWTASRLVPFLDLVDPAEQLDYWRQHLNTARFRCALDTLLRPRALARFYDSALLAQLPANFGQVLRHRLERGFARHPNRTNPYLHRLLRGTPIPTATPTEPIIWHVADAAAFLAQAPPQSFEGFTISNILDGATATYADQLYAAMARAASPGAHVVVRSFAEPATPLAAQDRSLLWGRITAQPLASARF